MPYKMIEGVYIYTKNDNYNNFPVYRRENDRNLGMYYHNDKKGNKLLVFGNNFGDGSLLQFGVAASLSSDPLSWLSSGTLNKSDVFSGLVQQWQYYNRSDQTDYNVPITASSPMIKAVCVDEDFRECNSDRVYLNERIDDKSKNILNDPTTDYFYLIEGLFRSLRPVYKHSAVSWYLQYVNTYWVISESYRPRLQCSVNKQCPPSNKFVYLERRPGDLGLSFCSGSYPSTTFHLCVDGNYSSYWSGEASLCEEENGTFGTMTSNATQDSLPDPQSQGTLKTKPINFDDYPFVIPFVIIIAILVQILLPFVLWRYASCKRKYKEAKNDHRRTSTVALAWN
ncbi:hypothetical protein ACROYT_G027212 [Oculina patagonica]